MVSLGLITLAPDDTCTAKIKPSDEDPTVIDYDVRVRIQLRLLVASERREVLPRLIKESRHIQPGCVTHFDARSSARVVFENGKTNVGPAKLLLARSLFFFVHKLPDRRFFSKELAIQFAFDPAIKSSRGSVALLVSMRGGHPPPGDWGDQTSGDARRGEIYAAIYDDHMVTCPVECPCHA